MQGYLLAIMFTFYPTYEVPWLPPAEDCRQTYLYWSNAAETISEARETIGGYYAEKYEAFDKDAHFKETFWYDAWVAQDPQEMQSRQVTAAEKCRLALGDATINIPQWWKH